MFLLPSVYACGPGFPLSLLSDKALTLKTLPQSNFHAEILRIGEHKIHHPFLVKPGDINLEDSEARTEIYTIAREMRTTSNKKYDWRDRSEEIDSQKIYVEKNQLNAHDYKIINAMRLTGNVQQAEALAADLSDELRWYTLGAVAFENKEYVLAKEYFQQVLNLPAAERPLRSTWAAYSLGRLQSGRMTADNLVKNTNAARKHFELVRQFAMDSFSDPLQLAIASFGEQALLDKNDDDWANAIQLYLEQLRQGSDDANQSLRVLADELNNLPESKLRLQLQKQTVQQLVTAYIISDLGWENNNPSQRSLKLIRLLLRSDITKLANADRLAALSYQTGNYADTRILLNHAGDGGLAWWLRAKIALFEGDKAGATVAYAKAARAFPQVDDNAIREGTSYIFESFQSRCRVEGESALLALDRGDYLEALQLFYRGGDIYWKDIALVAERILTADELKTFVDKQGIPTGEMNGYQDASAYDYLQPTLLKLRELLGRRLLREGRYHDAIAYFNTPELKKAADQYGQGREMGNNARDKIARAEGLYNALAILRSHGMELLGYEFSPDYFIIDGGSEYADNINYSTYNESGQWSADELTRLITSKAQPNKRYHYRYLVADLAKQAADLLPARSEAFGDVLCPAHDILVNIAPQLAQSYNRRYILEGAFYAEARRNPMSAPCDAPNFELARERLWKYRRLALYEAIQPYKGVLISTILIILLVGGGWAIKRRKQIFSK